MVGVGESKQASGNEGDGVWGKAAVDILRVPSRTRGCMTAAFSNVVLQSRRCFIWVMKVGDRLWVE